MEHSYTPPVSQLLTLGEPRDEERWKWRDYAALGISAEAVAAEKNVGYEREIEAAIARVDRGEAQIAFLLKAVRVQQVADIALAGDVLPQKSTDFYPKLLSGLAMYTLD